VPSRIQVRLPEKDPAPKSREALGASRPIRKTQEATVDHFGSGKPHKYVGVLSHVREVTLQGRADLRFWENRLRAERLVPDDFDGQARILISAIESRFLGLKFRELCIAVVVSSNEDRAAENGFYFVQAFNSSRFFAAAERRLFSTPYLHGRITVDARLPASIGLNADTGDSFRAEMSPATAHSEPLRTETEGWERAIFLPRSGRGDTRKLFFAKVCGHTQTFAFSPQQDVIIFDDSPRSQVFGCLIDSGFSGLEWSIRENATHARSKTYVTRLS
jgi:hypothetical protein